MFNDLCQHITFFVFFYMLIIWNLISIFFYTNHFILRILTYKKNYKLIRWYFSLVTFFLTTRYIIKVVIFSLFRSMTTKTATSATPTTTKLMAFAKHLDHSNWVFNTWIQIQLSFTKAYVKGLAKIMIYKHNEAALLPI